MILFRFLIVDLDFRLINGHILRISLIIIPDPDNVFEFILNFKFWISDFDKILYFDSLIYIIVKCNNIWKEVNIMIFI